MWRGLPSVCAALLLGVSAGVQAESIAGICPDGSVFVVQSREDAPCARPKFADPSELPPIRPELLPRPYTWYVDQEGRDANNPYYLLDAARKIRATQAPETPEAPGPISSTPGEAPEMQAAVPLGLALHESEIRDLVRLVALRQQVAPAALTLRDVEGRDELFLRFAHSDAFEARVLGILGTTTAASRVILFSARSVRSSEFHPNFLLVRQGATFRPDPDDPNEVGFIVGDVGKLEAGYLVLGYLVLPARFDPSAELELWWNDRSLASVLRP